MKSYSCKMLKLFEATYKFMKAFYAPFHKCHLKHIFPKTTTTISEMIKLITEMISSVHTRKTYQ